MADFTNTIGGEAPSDEEQVTVLYQVGKIHGVDFLLHAIGFTIKLQRAISWKRDWLTMMTSSLLWTRTFGTSQKRL
jgi:hypothetical protein